MSFNYDRYLRAGSEFEDRHYRLIVAGMDTPQYVRYLFGYCGRRRLWILLLIVGGYW